MSLERLPSLTGRVTFSSAIEHFLLHQRASRHSERTITGYAHVLGRLNEWLASAGTSHLDEVSPNLLRQFFLELSETPTQYGKLPSIGTQWTYHRCFKAFFRFHAEEETIEANPMRRIKPPRLDKQILPALSDQEVRRLEAATAGKTAADKRNRALVFFLLDTGCRRTEVANMRLGDIDLKTGIVRVRLGKGRKDRITRIGSKSMIAMVRYLRTRGELHEDDPLWVGKRGAISSEGVATLLQKLGAACGVHANAHRFRRTMALSMLRAGCDVYSLQSLLGHSDLEVLRRYLAQTETDVVRAHMRFSPVDQL